MSEVVDGVGEVDVGSNGGRWTAVGTVDEVVARKKFVVEDGDEQILVIYHDGGVYAMDNICIHKQRPMLKGVILRNRLVCPGHQWAFELDSGWESVKEECQPTYAVRVTDDGAVEVDLDSKYVRRTVAGVCEDTCGAR